MSAPGRPARAIPATYMRGGTSKGVFFCASDLPTDPAERDQLLLRVLGSPDVYGKQIDGLGGASSSTSKIVIVERSARPAADVEYLFGQVAIDRPLIDYSGNCGNLTTAVAPFALAQGLVRAERDGVVPIRLWQRNIGKPIIAHVPIMHGAPVEDGDFVMDGVPFAAAAIELEFLDAGGGADAPLLPTGNVIDRLEVPGVGRIEASLVNAGSEVAFIDAAAIGLIGIETQAAVNGDRALLARLEAIRAQAAVAMGLAASAAAATRERPATPRVSFVAPPRTYVASSGRTIDAAAIDFTARIVSMGQLHHAYTGTGAVAVAVAAALPGSIVHRAAGGVSRDGRVRVGHVAGTMTVGASVRREQGTWIVDRAIVSRSARRLMTGHVFVPAP